MNYFVNYIFREEIKGALIRKSYFSLSQQTGEKIEFDKRKKKNCFLDKIISLKK